VPADVNTVEWVFEGLAPGTYDVSATWVGHPNRATNAPFTASDSSGAVAPTAFVDQEPNPDDFVSDGANWEVILPSVTIGPDQPGGLTGTLIIELSDQATNGYVIADAVMVQFIAPAGQGLRASTIGSSPSADELTEADLAAVVTEATTLWQSTGLSGAEQARLDSVQVHVAELPTNVLGWTIDNSSTVWIDTDAAGHDWKYEGRNTKGEIGSAGPQSMDLLTVLAHELGHLIGYEHGDGDGVMSSTLGAGVRALPASDANHQTTRPPDTLRRSRVSSVVGLRIRSVALRLSALDSPLFTLVRL
jgi:hypothetical protein